MRRDLGQTWYALDIPYVLSAGESICPSLQHVLNGRQHIMGFEDIKVDAPHLLCSSSRRSRVQPWPPSARRSRIFRPFFPNADNPVAEPKS